MAAAAVAAAAAASGTQAPPNLNLNLNQNLNQSQQPGMNHLIPTFPYPHFMGHVGGPDMTTNAAHMTDKIELWDHDKHVSILKFNVNYYKTLIFFGLIIVNFLKAAASWASNWTN